MLYTKWMALLGETTESDSDNSCVLDQFAKALNFEFSLFSDSGIGSDEWQLQSLERLLQGGRQSLYPGCVRGRAQCVRHHRRQVHLH